MSESEHALQHISSLEDPRLDPYRSLKRTNETRWAAQFVVEGTRMAERLLASRFPVDSLLVSERNVREFLESAPVAGRTIPEVLVIPDAMVEALVGFNFHRGVLACGRRLPEPPVESLLGKGDPNARTPATLVVCPDLHDPENLGGMFRVAAALGASGMIVGVNAADPLSRRVLRVSMGTALKLPFAVSHDLPADLAQLRAAGVELAATVLDESAEVLRDARRAERLAVLFGNEGHGLSPEVLALCDRRITIPMHWETDSLNVVVSAGIVLHHFLG